MGNTIQSKIIGNLSQDENFEDWWHSQPVEIPFLEKAIPITFTDYIKGRDENFIAEADEAIQNFISFGINYREGITSSIYGNCMEFLDAVGYDEADEHLWKIKNQMEIWQYVRPLEIYITRRHRRDKNVYISVICECDWEQEHGLQLVFRQGKKLTRVSDQDGHITEADAYDKPDSEDKLLSSFHHN